MNEKNTNSRQKEKDSQTTNESQIEDKMVKKMRNEAWEQLRVLVNNYEIQLHRFEPELFNIQKHPNLTSQKKPVMQALYKELRNHLHNLGILKEELKSNKKVDEAERDVIFEASEQVLTKSYDFIKTLPEKLTLK